VGSFEYPAEWFQSVNAILIFTLAPLFAMMWVRLARAGKEPSTPAKMLVGLIFMGLSFLAMVGAAISENATTSRAPLAAVPAQVKLEGLDAGRMSFDPQTKELVVQGVLAQFAVNDALKKAAPPLWVSLVDDIEGQAKEASAAKSVQIPLLRFAPPELFSIFNELEPRLQEMPGFRRVVGAVEITAPLSASTRMTLIGEGAPSEWRGALKELQAKSQAARVSGLWLFLSYLLATLGELCLSPVGLSMVTKLAPVRFASLFMGVWLLASSVAQYMGGAIGESWGKVTPTSYFTLFVWTSVAGVVVLVALVSPLRRLMHKVH
jgi:POT family proton-dependent oligopeptide transporter